jgi:hypothetical protein
MHVYKYIYNYHCEMGAVVVVYKKICYRQVYTNSIYKQTMKLKDMKTKSQNKAL